MYVISYDVNNDKIRNKISKELQNYGRRVQYSVFECRISEKQLHILYPKLSKLINQTDDSSIRIYSLCTNCEAKIMTIGIENEAMTLEEEELFII